MTCWALLNIQATELINKICFKMNYNDKAVTDIIHSSIKRFNAKETYTL